MFWCLPEGSTCFAISTLIAVLTTGQVAQATPDPTICRVDQAQNLAGVELKDTFETIDPLLGTHIQCIYEKTSGGPFSGSLNFQVNCRPGTRLVHPGFEFADQPTAERTSIMALIPKFFVGGNDVVEVVTLSANAQVFNFKSYAVCRP
jgi:hypothetical protein